MMQKIYQVYENLYITEVQEIECTKVTDSNYWTTTGSRRALNTNDYKSFDEELDAINYMGFLIKRKLSSAKSTLEYYEKIESNFKAKYQK